MADGSECLVGVTAVNPQPLGEGDTGPEKGSVWHTAGSTTLGHPADFKIKCWQTGFTGSSWLSSYLLIVDKYCHSPPAFLFLNRDGQCKSVMEVKHVSLFQPRKSKPQPLPCHSRWTIGCYSSAKIKWKEIHWLKLFHFPVSSYFQVWTISDSMYVYCTIQGRSNFPFDNHNILP